MNLRVAVALLALLGASVRLQASGERDAPPACEAAPRAAVPAGWTRTTLHETFSIALPPSCQPDAGARYVHGGTRWKCGTVMAEVVWGMWGTGSFADTAKKCTAKVEGLKVMVVREQRDKGAAVEVLYRTGEVHEPLVGAWSDRPEDVGAVEAVVFSGKR